ncbi:hypothetical protein H4R19_002122 [Coemansia spiralis]|nr:hypothetical protein H4R19_002122 [Coemansia spiralis]
MVDGKFNEIHGWAAMGPGIKVEPWSYTPRPLGNNDVEVKVMYTGICGSDIHITKNEWGNSVYPQIAGHEIVGTVVSKGPAVEGLEIGDTVGMGVLCYTCRKHDCRPCATDMEHYCPHQQGIIGGAYPDGARTHGGFAEAVRVDAFYVSKIPAAIDPAHAPPLMCAGLTAFSSMVLKGVKPGDRVGVLGIGGLGHLALQFARALGAEVVAISHSANKQAQSMELGATHFVDTSDKTQAAALRGTLDYLFVCSAAGASNYSEFITWMTCLGQIAILGLHTHQLKIYPAELVFTGTSVSGSQIGSTAMTRRMLAFAVEHNIRPMIERFHIANINKAIARVASGQIRYRAVLEL